MAQRKFGWHSGALTANQITVEDSLTVNGNLTFGDASTDTLTVTGLSTFSAAMDINATLDIDAVTTSTNAIVDVAQTGTGKVLRLDQNNTVDPSFVLEIDDEATGSTNEVVKVASLRTGSTITVNHESTGAGVVVTATNAGTGKTLLLDANNTTDPGVVLEVDDEATGNTSEAVKVASLRTGATVTVNHESTGAGLVVTATNAGTGGTLLLDANNTADPGIVLEVDDEATGNTSAVIKVASLRTGATVTINHESTGAGVVFTATNAGTSGTVLLDQNNTTGPAGSVIEVDDESTGNTNAVVKVASLRTGNLLLISAEGASTNAAQIDTADGMTGTALYINHNETDGAAVGLHIDVASTGATAFAMKVTGIATDSGVFQTNAVGTDAAIDNMTGTLRVQCGSTTYYLPLLSTFT